MRDRNGRSHDSEGKFGAGTSSAPEAVLRPTYQMPSVSKRDDAAFVALGDVATMLDALDALDVRDAEGDPVRGGVVVGGHMVALLLLRYGPTGTIDRGTGDADVGLSIPIAAQGAAHLLLLEMGYVAESGNRYVKPVETAEKPTVDLLVPSFTGTHRTEVLGGRGFDAVAGLSAALTDNERMRVNATLLNGHELPFEVNVPTVSAAIALKAAAWAGRHAPKDETDLYNLFQIVEQNQGLIDRYRGELRATYLDAARSLHRLADSLEARPPGRGFNARFLASAIRTHISFHS